MRPLVLAALLAVPASLAPSARAADPPNPGTYTHLTTRRWFTLEPAGAYDSVSLIIVANVYEPLITFRSARDPESLEPFLAEKVPTRANGLVSGDGTTYTFPIREGVRFHSGDPLTAEDVRYSILRFMLHDMRMGSALLLKPILGVYSTRGDGGRLLVDFKTASEAVRVVDGAVVVRLKAPDSTFLKALASLPIVVSKRWCAANGEWDGTEATWKSFNKRHRTRSYLHTRMNGTGPFRLEIADRESGVVALRRNESYWRKKASLERAVLKVVPSPALRLWMLENGDADGSYFEDRDFREIREISGTTIVEDLPFSSIGEILHFTFKTDPASEHIGSGRLDGKGVPPDFFSDRRVREGFAHALDYAGYLKRGLGARGKRARGPFPETLLSSAKLPARSFDLKKAEAAFRSAYGGRVWKTGFALTLAYSPSNAQRVVLAELLAESLKKINPKFRLRIAPMASKKLYSSMGRHKLPLYIASFYGEYPDAQTFAFGLLHSQGYGAKSQRYANSAIDKLIDRARAARDAGERRRLFVRMARLADRDLPQIYTYQPARFRVFRDWVRDSDPDQNHSNLGLNNYPYFYTLSK